MKGGLFGGTAPKVQCFRRSTYSNCTKHKNSRFAGGLTQTKIAYFVFTLGELALMGQFR
jgi:hypothetical protein